MSEPVTYEYCFAEYGQPWQHHAFPNDEEAMAKAMQLKMQGFEIEFLYRFGHKNEGYGYLIKDGEIVNA